MAIRIPIISDFYEKGIKNAERSFKDLAKTSLLTGAAVAGVAKFLADSVKAAAADEKAQALLARQLQNTTYASREQIAEVEKFIGATQDAAAVADDLLRPALGNLVRATKDVERAQKLLGLALDISAATGKDLETVSLGLSKAVTGNIGALTRLGVPLDQNKVKAKDLDGIINDLSTTFRGSANRAANTFEGQMAKLGLAIEDIKEEIGRALIPVLNDLAREMLPLLRRTRDVTSEMDKLGFTIGNTRFSVSNFFGVVAKKAFLGPFALFTQLGEKIDKVTESIIRSGEALGILDKFTLGGLNRYQMLLDEEQPEKAAKGIDKVAEAAKKLRERFKDARQEAADLVEKAIKMRDEFAQTIGDAIRNTVNFGSIRGEIVAAGAELANLVKEGVDQNSDAFKQAAANAGKSFMTRLGETVAKAQEFGAKLRQLMQAGLSQQAIAQIAQSGAEAGTAIADELLAGGAATIAQANSLVAAAEQAAIETGTLAGATYYNEGVVLAQQLTQGITDIISKYKIKLSSAGLTEKQLKRLRNRFAVDVDFVMQNVPALADGGIVTSPTLALIGEAGPEAVVPLSKGGAMGNVTINVNGGDPNAVVDALRTYMRQNGSVPIRVSNLY